MKSISLPSGSFLLIEVPEDKDITCEIRGEHSKRPYQLLSFYGDAEAIQLPPGNWHIIGKGNELEMGKYEDFEILKYIHEKDLSTTLILKHHPNE